MADDVKVVVKAEDQASQVFSKVGDNAKKMGSDVSKASDTVVEGNGKMTKSLLDNKEGLLAVGSASGIAFAGLASIGTMAIQQASKMQDLRIELDVLAGSAEKGGELFKNIQKEASKTPFESQDLVRATSTMLQFGIAQEDVMGNMRMLGDISGGNANKLQSLSLVFGQISSAGKLTGQDLLQLINLGFNPLKTMSDRTGESMSSLRDKMSDGKISFEMVQNEMQLATKEGGLFFGMMDKKSQTFTGLMSTLSDNVGIALASLGGFSDGTVVKGGLLDSLSGAMQKIMPLLDSVVQWANKNPEMAKNIFLFATALTGLVAGFSAVAFILPTLTAGFQLMMGPVGLVILGITALFFAFQTNFLGIRDIAGAVWDFFATLPERWKAIVAGVKSGLDSLSNFFTNVFEGIKIFVGAVRDGIVLIFKTQLDLTIAVIGGFIGIFVGIFQSFLALLQGDWQGAWEIFSQTFINVWNGIVEFITPLLELLGSIFSTAWAGITNAFKITRNGIKTFFYSIWEGIKGVATAGINWLVGFFGGGGKAMIEGAFTAMLSGFVGIAKSVINGVVGAFEGMINFAILGINKLIDAANSVSPIRIGKVGNITLPRLAKGGFVDGASLGEIMGNVGHFANGGLVSGPKGIDKVPAMLSDGELVLNKAQQGNLASFLGGQSGGSKIEITVSGNNFYGDDASFAEKIGDTIVAQFRKNYSFETF